MRFITAISLIFLWSLASYAETYLLKPSFVFDVENGKLLKNTMVRVEDNRIVAVGDEGSVNSDGATVIDLSGLTLMPGLIDAHSHVLLHPYNETSWTDQVLRESWAERTLRAGNHLKATLNAGFTSLRDLGSEGAGYMDVGIRKALEKGVIEGPRLIVAGKAIVATGSYGPSGYDLSHTINLGAEPADGADLVRVVRDQIGKGADFIKIYADYRWGPNGEARPTFSLEELKTIVETARDSGRVTVAHAATDEGMRRAILAGVQSIEHGDGASLDTFKLMAEKGVIFCPTVAAGDAIAQYRGWNKVAGDAEPARIQTKRQSMKYALEAGVEICNGSDVGVFPHGDNLRELLLLEDYGLDRASILKAATMVGAKLMGRQDLGQVNKGFLADLIAFSGNPLENLESLKKIDFIMINGQIAKQP